MKLVASMIVRNELGRYLEPCLANVLEGCDEVRIVDDGSADGTLGYLESEWAGPRVALFSKSAPTFYEHEGHARQQLLDWTLTAEPTHVLAIDADEFLSDPVILRANVEKVDREVEDLPTHRQRRVGRRRSMKDVFTLLMEEVWEADESCLRIRVDGGWKPHPVPILWRVPPEGIRPGDRTWRIQEKALACGREPLAIRRVAAFAKPTHTSILHFGWARVSERRARHARYVEHDGGSFHARRHLDSIMWPRDRIRLQEKAWPAGLRDRKAEILERVNR